MKLALLFTLIIGCGDEADTQTKDTSDSTTTTTDTETDTEVISDESNRDGYCGFNYDCPADQRCECSELDGCACADGERGTGENGIDQCETGNDCISSLCVEGQDDYYCSDLCETDEDCNEALPVCMDVSFVGRICVRDGQ